MSDYQLVSNYETVEIYRSGAVAKVVLNRPDRMNAWNKALGLELLDAVRALADDRKVRAVMITGAGRAFTSGADLRDQPDPTPAGHPDVYSVLTGRYHPIITGIRNMAKPVVAAVNGAAAGIGLSLALACDLVLAAESAYFLLAFVNIGLVPDGGSSLLVPSRIGFARAAELAMLGERLPAAKALEWGLINQVWPDDELAGRADELVAKLADGPTRSYAGTKRQLNKWLYEHIDGQLEFEAQIQQQMAESGDFAEGVAAFTEKREARFTGS
jgi:2-(1,2-epoxy-1,2-dihydrophenyl)acetyl-CoA isomerase